MVNYVIHSKYNMLIGNLYNLLPDISLIFGSYSYTIPVLLNLPQITVLAVLKINLHLINDYEDNEQIRIKHTSLIPFVAELRSL